MATWLIQTEEVLYSCRPLSKDVGKKGDGESR